MAGMRAMAKHPHFSPCDQRGAGHAGRRAQHRPLNQENVLVWKQHSSLSAFMGEFLHTHTYHPEPCMSVSPRFTPLRFIPSPLLLRADWSLLIYDWINGERCSLLQLSMRPPRLLYLSWYVGAFSSLYIFLRRGSLSSQILFPIKEHLICDV